MLTLFASQVALATTSCTLNHNTDAALATLRVVAGSGATVVLDTHNTAVAQAMVNAGCANTTGGAQSLAVEDHTLNPSGQGILMGDGTITYPDGSIVTIAHPNSDLKITFTPGPGVTGTKAIFPTTASYAGSQNSNSGSRVLRLYGPETSNNNQIVTINILIVPPNPPTSSVTVNPTSGFAGSTSTATVTLFNPPASGVGLTGVGNTINLPAGVTVAATPGQSTTCSGGSVTATAGSSTVTLAGASLATNTSCTMTFNFTASTVTTHTIPSGTPTSTESGTGVAGSTATFTATTPPNPPTLAAAWDQADVAVGAARTLTVTLTNPNAVQLTGVGLNFAALDSTFSGSGQATSCGGTPAYDDTTKRLSLSGGTLNAGASCTLTLSVTNNTRGTYNYTTGTAFATGPVLVTGGAGVSAGTLTVWSPPTITAAVTSPIGTGTASTLTLTFTNANAGSLTGVGTTISLPGNVSVFSTPGVANGCSGGSVPATAGATSVAITGLTVANGSCTVSFSITASAATTYAIPTGTPTSTQGGTGVAGADASLVVNLSPPVLTGVAAPGPTITYNAVAAAIPALSATNSPTSWVVSKTAGGSFDLTAQSANSSATNVTIDGTTGAITYTAPTGYRGADLFYVRASNGANSNVVAVNLTVGNPTLAISRVGSGVRDTALSGVSIATTGGRAPYECGAPSTPLQSGLTLNLDCSITGTPTVSGVVNFTVAVTDTSLGDGRFTQTSGPLQLTVVPPPPTITSLVPARGSTAGGTSLRINGTDFGPSEVTSVEIDGTSRPFVVDGSGTFITVTTQAHAAGTVDVSVTTTGGTSPNTANDDFTFATPPAAPVVSAPVTGSRTNDTTPTYSGTAGADGLTITVYVNGSDVGTTLSSGGAWSLTPSGPLPEGTYTVRATATELGVTSGDSNMPSFVVDTTAPAAPVVTAPVSGTSTNDNTPTFTGTAETDSTVSVYVGGVLRGTAVASGGTWTFTTATLADATYSFWATATDVAGNIGPQSTTGTLTVDTVDPAAPVISAPTAGESTSRTPTISGTTEAGSTVSVTIDSLPPQNATVTGTSWTLNWSPALAVGPHTVSATATDAALNASAAASVGFVAVAQPVVTNVLPVSGPLGGGASVTLTGTDLANATAVKFGTTSATITANSATSITATAPSASVAGTVNVTVTTAGGTSIADSGNEYTYVAAPVVSSITPTFGPASGATSVTINGANLGGVTAVDFGGTPAASFAPINANSLTAVSPPGSGVVDITVTTVGGTSATSTNDRFTFVDPATVTNFGTSLAFAATAAAIDVAGGANPSEPVTGWQVATASGGTFGASAATERGGTVSINAAGSATYTAPANFRGLDRFYYIATNGGGASNEGVAQVTVGDPVLVIGLSATSVDMGTTLSGASLVVTVSGNGTTGYSCGAPSAALATGLTLNANCTITGTPTAFGDFDFTVPVTVATVGPLGSDPYTTTSTTLRLTVNDSRPTVTTIAPASGTTAGGTPVTITGSYLSNPSAVSFGGIPASSFSPGSATTMTAVAPPGAGTGNVVVTTAIGSSAAAPANLYTWVPPAPTVLTPVGGSTTANNRPVLSGTAQANANVNLSVDGGGAVTVSADGAGNWTYTPAAALPDGAHDVQATATVGGITGAASTLVTFTIDASPPGTPVISVPANNATVNDNTPDLGGTAEAGATVTIYIDGTQRGTTIATGGAWSFTAPTLSDAQHNAHVTATDAVGNLSSPSAAIDFIVDTAAPNPPVVAAPANGSVTNVATPAIAGTAEASATVTVYIDGGVAGTTIATGGNWTFTPVSALADGLHSVHAIATDAGGNVSAVSNTNNFTVDAAVPLAPVVTAPVDGLLTTVATQTITGTGEVGGTVTVYLNAAPIGTATVAAGGGWSLSTGARPDGAYVVTATVTDAAGNVSPASAPVNYTIDSAAPGAPVLTAPAEGLRTSDSTPTITGTAEAGATVTVYIDGGVAGTAVATGGSWTFTSAALTEGSHTVEARATDATGNVSAMSPTRNFAVDTTPPPAPVLTAPANGATIATNTPLIGGTAEPNATLTVSIDGTPLGTAAANASGIWSFQTVSPLAAGNHAATATATDAAGNVSGSGTTSFLVEFPPVASDLSGVSVPYNAAQAIDLAPSIAGNYASIAIGTAPAHGTTSVAGMVVTYTPASDYFGPDSFTYAATGPGGTSNVATVSLTVATPSAPVTADKPGVVVGYQSAGIAIDLAGSITGVHASIAVATAPAHGTTSIAGDVVTYIPAAGYYGADSFTFTATGPGGTSNVSTVGLTVGNPPAPVAADRSGVAVSYESAGTAIDLAPSITGVHASIAIVTAPAHGTASIAGDVVTYIPAAGYYGPDSFTYTASGPGGTSAVATVSLSVGLPPPPTAQPTAGTVAGSTSVNANNTVQIDLSALVTGRYDSIEIGTPPAHGTVTLSGGAPIAAGGGQHALAITPVIATYRPATAYVGTDSFTYVAVGPGGRSAAAAVTINVVGSVPVALPKTAATGDGQAVIVDLTAGASEGPFTGAAVVSVTPANSATTRILDSGSGAARTFRLEVTPNARFSGSVVIAYTLANAYGVSAPANVTVTVTARPDPTADPNVRAISDAQAETTRRFARSQVSNFMRRTEQLHGSGGKSDAMGVTLNSRDGRGPIRTSPAFDASALEITERMRPSAEDPMLGAVTNSRDSRWNRADMLGGMASVTPSGPHGRGGDRNSVAQPGAGEAQRGQAGHGDADDDGTRRKGSIAIWSGGAIDIGTRDATTDRTKITATTSGLSGGADVKLAEGVVLGLGGGYGNDITRIGDGAARVRSTSSLVAAYASVSPGGTAFIDGVFGVGDLSFSTRRLVATLNADALGSRDGNFTIGALAAGIDAQGEHLRWSVYGRGEMMDARLGSYAESGAGRYNLRFDERQLSSITGTLGGRIEFTGTSGSTEVTPRIRAEWNHEFADADPQLLDYADIPGGALFSLGTTGWQRDQFQLSLGTRLVFPSSWAIDVEGGARGGSGERAGTLRIQISKDF